MEDFYIQAYKLYRRILNDNTFSKCLTIIEYNDIESPTDRTMPTIIYSEFLSEHRRQLANDINCFRRNLIKLQSWRILIKKYKEDEQYNLMVEFIESIIILLHDYPSSIRDRFIFSLSHLCHQANSYTTNEWKDNLPKNQYIKQRDMNEKCSSWKYFQEFNLIFTDLFGDEYKSKTQNYRNMMHHRIPINTGFGLSNIMTREKDKEGKISYSFGYIEPLSLDKTIDLMKQQHIVMCKCFLEYEKLLTNQVHEINNKMVEGGK